MTVVVANINEAAFPYQGELAALGGAFLWASASTIYARAGRTVAPLVLNLTKGLVAMTLMLLTLGLQQVSPPNLDAITWLLLIGSGIVGIGIGDTTFFAALNRLGPRRTVLCEALAPPLTALLAIVFLSETLTWQGYAGILLTMMGVTWVVFEQTPKDSPRHYKKTDSLVTGNAVSSNPRENPTYGILYGLITALCQASGAIMSRAALLDTNIGPLWSGLIRLSAGTLAVAGLISWRSRERKALQVLRSPSLLALIAVTSFGGTFLAIWLQQTGFKYAEAGVVQTLLSTSSLFVIPLAVAMGDRVSLRSVLGAAVALAGIWLLFYQGG